MATRNLPTPSQLRQLLHYEPETGVLVWREREPELFASGQGQSAERLCASWNRRYAGKRAFVNALSTGYLTGTVFGKTYSAHRVAWALHYGEWPNGQIDHINGDKADNCIQNLRDTTATINNRNSRIQRNNKSGVTGVFWNSRIKRWRAVIYVNGRCVELGHFVDIKRAAEARCAAEKRIGGFTERHGR